MRKSVGELGLVAIVLILIVLIWAVFRVFINHGVADVNDKSDKVYSDILGDN